MDISKFQEYFTRFTKEWKDYAVPKNLLLNNFLDIHTKKNTYNIKLFQIMYNASPFDIEILKRNLENPNISSICVFLVNCNYDQFPENEKLEIKKNNQWTGIKFSDVFTLFNAGMINIVSLNNSIFSTGSLSICSSLENNDICVLSSSKINCDSLPQNVNTCDFLIESSDIFNYTSIIFCGQPDFVGDYYIHMFGAVHCLLAKLHRKNKNIVNLSSHIKTYHLENGNVTLEHNYVNSKDFILLMSLPFSGDANVKILEYNQDECKNLIENYDTKTVYDIQHVPNFTSSSLSLEDQSEINKMKSFILYTYKLKQEEIFKEKYYIFERERQEFRNEIEKEREEFKNDIEKQLEQFRNEHIQKKLEDFACLEREINVLKAEKLKELEKEFICIKEEEREKFQINFNQLLQEKSQQLDKKNNEYFCIKMKETDRECLIKKEDEFLKIDALAEEYSNEKTKETTEKLEEELKNLQQVYDKKFEGVRNSYIANNKKELAEANLELELFYDKNSYDTKLKEYKQNREIEIKNELDTITKNYNEVLHSAHMELLEEQREKRLLEHSKHRDEMLTNLNTEIELKHEELYESYSKELENRKFEALQVFEEKQKHEIEKLKQKFEEELKYLRINNKEKTENILKEDNENLEKERINYHNRQLKNIEIDISIKQQEKIEIELKKIKEEKLKAICDELDNFKHEKLFVLHQKESDLKTRIAKMFFILHEAFGDIFQKDSITQ